MFYARWLARSKASREHLCSFDFVCLTRYKVVEPSTEVQGEQLNHPKKKMFYRQARQSSTLCYSYVVLCTTRRTLYVLHDIRLRCSRCRLPRFTVVSERPYCVIRPPHSSHMTSNCSYKLF